MEGKCRHIWRKREIWRKRDGVFVSACKKCRFEWARARLLASIMNPES